MELSKDDIKTIGYRRFNKSHMKYFYGLVFGAIGLMVGLMLGINPESVQLTLAIAIPVMLLVIVGLYFYNRAAEKFAKSFVEECEANPTLTYVPEATKEAENVIG